MAGSLVAVGAVYYVVQATASDGDLLDLFIEARVYERTVPGRA